MSRRLAAALASVSALAAVSPAAAHMRPEPSMASAPESLLAAPPADAPPGVCYAHVRVPGRTVTGPPEVGGAHWELRPPPPGAIGPVWCLVPDAPRARTMVMPEREGWIQVECDSGRPPPPPPCPPKPVKLHDGWLSWHGKTYF